MAAVRRAQAIVRRHVPADVFLVDELIAEGRSEAGVTEPVGVAIELVR